MQKLYKIPHSFWKDENQYKVLKEKIENIIYKIDKLKLYMDDTHMNNFMLLAPNSLDVFAIDFGEVIKSKDSTSNKMLSILEYSVKGI